MLLTSRDICTALDLDYQSFLQYVHYWNLKPISREGRNNLYSQETLYFIKERRDEAKKGSKYDEWNNPDIVLPPIDNAFSGIGESVSILCIVKDQRRRYARFDYLKNRWIDRETGRAVSVRKWKDAQEYEG
jgi:hypothetical protein